MMMMMMYT